MGTSKRARSVWIDADGEVMHIGAVERRQRDFGFALHVSELASVSATDLRHALDDDVLYSPTVVVTDTAMEWISEDYVPPQVSSSTFTKAS